MMINQTVHTDSFENSNSNIYFLSRLIQSSALILLLLIRFAILPQECSFVVKHHANKVIIVFLRQQEIYTEQAVWIEHINALHSLKHGINVYLFFLTKSIYFSFQLLFVLLIYLVAFYWLIFFLDKFLCIFLLEFCQKSCELARTTILFDLIY